MPDITAEEPGNKAVPASMSSVMGPVSGGLSDVVMPRLVVRADGDEVAAKDVTGKSNVAIVTDDVVPPVTTARTLSCANCTFGDKVLVPGATAEYKEQVDVSASNPAATQSSFALQLLRQEFISRVERVSSSLPAKTVSHCT